MSKDILDQLDELKANSHPGLLVHTHYAYDKIYKWTAYFEDMLLKNKERLTVDFVEIVGTALDENIQNKVMACTGNGPTSSEHAEFIAMLLNNYDHLAKRLRAAEKVCEQVLFQCDPRELSTRDIWNGAAEWRAARELGLEQK